MFGEYETIGLGPSYRFSPVIRRANGFSYDAVKIFCDKNGRMTKVEPQAQRVARRARRGCQAPCPRSLIQSAMKTRPFLICGVTALGRQHIRIS